jgi:hypothetical protein
LGLILVGSYSIPAEPCYATHSAQDSGTKEKAPNSSTALSDKISFKLVFISDSIGKDGEASTTFTYLASDGNKLHTSCIALDSPAAAVRKLHAQIGAARRVVERGVVKNKDGKTVGERAVLLVPTEDPSKPVATLIRTNGASYCVISSESLKDALEFEKLFRPRS